MTTCTVPSTSRTRMAMMARTMPEPDLREQAPQLGVVRGLDRRDHVSEQLGLTRLARSARKTSSVSTVWPASACASERGIGVGAERCGPARDNPANVRYVSS